jgi:hypothetical protein
LLLLAGAAAAATVSGFAATAASLELLDSDFTAAAVDFDLVDAFLAGEVISAVTAMVAAGAAAAGGASLLRAVCYSAQSGQQ